MVRSKRKRARERSLGVGWFSPEDVDAPQLDRELRDARGKLDALLEHSLGIVVTAHAAEDEAELVERGREHRLAVHRALEPIDRLVSASDVAKRQGVVRLEQRIDGVTPSLRERTDGLAGALLDQEGEAQEVQRAGMLRMSAQHLAHDSLGFVRSTSVDGGPTEIKGLLIRSDRNPIRVFVVHARPTSFRRQHNRAHPQGRLGH